MLSERRNYIVDSGGWILNKKLSWDDEDTIELVNQETGEVVSIIARNEETE